GLLPAILLSHLSHGNLFDARAGALFFLPVLLYYFLLVGLVNSPERFRIFLRVFLALTLTVAALSVLNYHGVLDNDGVFAMKQWDDTGEEGAMIVRVQGSGIFGDPNDFCLILVAGVVLSVHFAVEAAGWGKRFVWLGVGSAVGYTISLTN